MGIAEDAGKQGDYVAYLLRMWRDSDDEEPPCPQQTAWRATLQSPHSGDRVGFANLDDLFDFLRGQTGSKPEADCVQNQV